MFEMGTAGGAADDEMVEDTWDFDVSPLDDRDSRCGNFLFGYMRRGGAEGGAPGDATASHWSASSSW
jgi:hypothetical protein